MNPAPKYRFPNFAKVIISLAEARLAPYVGLDTLKELKKPFLKQELTDRLAQAILAAEGRFVAANSTDDIAQSLNELPIAESASMREAIWIFFERPTAPDIQVELANQIKQILPADYAEEKITRAVQDYLWFIKEEMTNIPDIREKLVALATLNIQKTSSQSLNTLEEIRDRLPVLENSQSADALAFASAADGLDAMVESFSKDFVGRKFAFDAIDSFVSNAKNGFFLIEGDPGIGKSSLIAQFIKQNKCIGHFNNRASGITSPGMFLESILSQLISRFSLPYQAADAQKRMRADSRFLMKVLDEAAGSVRDHQKIMIAVDALDEVESPEQSGPNILFLPAQLPENIFFILSSRRKSVNLVTYAPFKLFDLTEYSTENERDIREYISIQIRRIQSLQNYISQKHLLEGVFIDQLIQKSELNFMYIKSILIDMQHEWYWDTDLNKLPQGLIKYYEEHWRQMGIAGDIDNKKESMIKIIYVLAEVIYPVSRQEISEITGEKEIFVQHVIDRWAQFLHVEFDANVKYYSIYHSSFRDFLYQQDIVSAAEVNLQQINALIAKKFRESLGF